MISHQYKCIFIHIPKCAGTSIEEAFGHFNGFEGRGGQDHRSIRDIDPFVRFTDVIKSRENITSFLKRIKKRIFKGKNPNNNLFVNKNQYRSYFKFVIVRNPWDRVFSAYKNIMSDEVHRSKRGFDNDLTFHDFIIYYVRKDRLTVPASNYIKNYDGRINIDFIGKFKNL